MTDDMPEDLPYLEMLYKFAYGKQSYYDLVAVKQVEPQANDRMRSEEEGTTDRHDRMGILMWRLQTNEEWARGVHLHTASLPRSLSRKKPTGESHHRRVFGFGNESEDGTGSYTT